VTPSDRAGATSAKRSASIPTQRSGQALRLLVLGTGDGAAAFRERAAEAGAELAQRFSVRVTHVVAEEGIGEEDARVVRARTAGLPVLDLAEGARLIDAEAADAGADAVGVVDAIADMSADAAIETEAAAGTDDVDPGEAFAEAEAAVDEAVTSDVHVVRPRSEFVPEPAGADIAPVEVGPADVFTGSALEAVLLFPPLTVGESDDDVDADFADGEQDESRSALMDVASAACACACDEAVTIGADSDQDSDRDLDRDLGPSRSANADSTGIDSEVVATEDAAAASIRPTHGTASSLAWALVPLVSLGLLTPASMAYAAYRLRSRALGAATAGYTIAVGAAFALSAATPLRTGAHAAIGDLLTVCLATSWLGGTVHSFLIRRRVFG
jgi:hypothetical protein